MSARLVIENVNFAYGDRPALRDVSLTVDAGEIFGLLGPNGGGKTTLFRLVTTLLPVRDGRIQVAGVDVQAAPARARGFLGVTFQSPSLDGRLTVRENLQHQGHLYGLAGRSLRERIEVVTQWLRVQDRLADRAETLSGGLKRRVEVAKSLLHRPALLVLDEPSTGLDPAARRDLWRALEDVRRDEGLSILVTTHLMEEAERCDRLAILDRGQLVALDHPQALRSSLGSDVLTLTAENPLQLAGEIESRFGVVARQYGSGLRIEHARPQEFLPQLLAEFGARIEAIAVAKPTLEDVFLARTGHTFWESVPSSGVLG